MSDEDDRISPLPEAPPTIEPGTFQRAAHALRRLSAEQLGHDTAAVDHAVAVLLDAEIALQKEHDKHRPDRVAAMLDRWAAEDAEDGSDEPELPIVRDSTWHTQAEPKRGNGPLDDPRNLRVDELVFAAERAHKAHDNDRARALYAEAAELEEAMAREVAGDLPRVRSVFAINTLVYWELAGDLNRAQRFARDLLLAEGELTETAKAALDSAARRPSAP